MMKKIIIAILLLLILAGVGGFVVWNFYYKDSSKSAENGNLTAPVKLTDESVVSAHISANDDSAFFANANGHIFTVSLSNRLFTELPSAAMPAQVLKKVLWSSSGNDFIGFGSDDPKNLIFHYNSTAKQYTVLPQNVIDVDWLPDGLRVAMIWQSGDKKSQQLVISNGDGSGYKIVAALDSSEYKIRVSPTGGEALLVSNRPKAVDNKIYLVNLMDGAIKPVVEEGNNLDAKWIDSNSFLMTRYDKPFPRLFLHDLAKSQTLDLQVNTELARAAYDKFSKKIIVAVAPMTSITDKIVKIDPATAASEDYKTSSNLVVSELFADSNNLLYISASDGKLYQIK